MPPKWPVTCDHCEKAIGFLMGYSPSLYEPIYCYECEAVVTHKEEMAEERIASWRAEGLIT